MRSSRTLAMLTAALAACALPAAAQTAAAQTARPHAPAKRMMEAETSSAVAHRRAMIDGIEIFYREAGPRDAPAILLLHGFPSSSHMFRDLIPLLAETAHVVAPDYPGFGFSAAPDAEGFDYDFATAARLVGGLTEALGLNRYALYMQDFGGPVGMRLALAHPERVSGIIVQNATFFVEGWNGDVVAQLAPYWRNPTAESEAPVRGFLSPATTRWQYEHGSTRTEALSPDAWRHDQAGLDRPGVDRAMLEYLFAYQDNVAQYPAWQAWLAERRPPALIVWGENDPFFTMAGVEALEALLPEARTRLYDAGHFALETHAPEIGAEVRAFLGALRD